MYSSFLFFWPALVGVCSLIYLLPFMIRKENQKKPAAVASASLPPGPRGLPILGSLLLLGDLPHHTLRKLAKEYGPIMHMRLGLVPTIVVSSSKAAKHFLNVRDLVFASRPHTEAGNYLSFGCKGMALTQYGAYWRNMRRVCTLELLSNLKITSFRSMRREEVGLFVQSLKDASLAQQPFNLTIKVAALVTDMTCRMVFGRKHMGESFSERGLKEIVEESVYLTGTFNISDYIPCIGSLDLQGLRRRMKDNNRFYDALLEKIIDEHLENRDAERQKDFVDFMLEFVASSDGEIQFDRSSIKAVMLEMFVAAVDTSSATIDWAMAELLKHPQALKKAQQELETVVGTEQAVEESDLSNLEYLNMVIKETMRLHPVVPLLLPHEATEDCNVDSFHIPKKSRIIVNVWAIGRDSSSWSNPEKFDPERFAGSTVDVRGRDFQLLPFGSGRRSCPGMQLGLTVVRLVLAQLLHCFDWELPNGGSPESIDMTEKFGIVTHRTKNLLGVPSYRLRK